MKRVGITQRVEFVKSYKESRDCLDQRWSKLFLKLSCLPIPLPNIDKDNISSLLDALSLDLIVFSGGNSIAVVDESANDIALQRDKFEAELLKEAMKRGIYILGICRGMQMINLQMGGKLSRIKNHVGVRHSINSLDKAYHFSNQVNSYHSWGITRNDLATKLKPLAIDSNGNIEAFVYEEKNIIGLMWHPEREEPFNKDDIKLIVRLLQKGLF